MSQVTRHATRRSRERLGIPKKTVNVNANKALRNGVHRERTTGLLRRYLDALWWADTPKDGIRVYHRNVYIFDGDVLITVIPLPRRYHAAADKLDATKATNDKTDGGAVNEGSLLFEVPAKNEFSAF